MALPFYFDQHAPAAIAHALRLRALDVLTAYQDGHYRADDEPLLLRTTALGKVLFTQDEDLLAIAHRYQAENHLFAGVVYAHQLRVSIGTCIADLEIISKASSAGQPGQPADARVLRRVFFRRALSRGVPGYPPIPPFVPFRRSAISAIGHSAAVPQLSTLNSQLSTGSRGRLCSTVRVWWRLRARSS